MPRSLRPRVIRDTALSRQRPLRPQRRREGRMLRFGPRQSRQVGRASWPVPVPAQWRPWKSRRRRVALALPEPTIGQGHQCHIRDRREFLLQEAPVRDRCGAGGCRKGRRTARRRAEAWGQLSAVPWRTLPARHIQSGRWRRTSARQHAMGRLTAWLRRVAARRWSGGSEVRAGPPAGVAGSTSTTMSASTWSACSSTVAGSSPVTMRCPRRPWLLRATSTTSPACRRTCTRATCPPGCGSPDTVRRRPARGLVMNRTVA